MPQGLAQGNKIDCDCIASAWRIRSTNLRHISLKNGLDLYNSGAKVFNGRRIGSSDTSKVEIEREVSQVDWCNERERSLFFHFPTTNLRSNRQTQVAVDVKATKFDGF